MKAKISELIGGPLDWAVASLNGVKPLLKLADSLEADGHLPYSFDLFHDIKTYKEVEDILAGKPHCSGLGSAELRAFAQELGYVIDQPVCPAFSTDYACGGPILERLVADGFEIRQATFSDNEPFQVFRVRGDKLTSAFGPTLLVAAMRCHLLHRLGAQTDAEIDVPDNLMAGTSIPAPVECSHAAVAAGHALLQSTDELSQAQDAICHLLSSAIDLSNGWPQRELHEPLSDTIQRGLAALPESLRGEFRVEHDPSLTDRARASSPAG